nr:hypothetical protein Q903MT_gene4422 [Picea sitchensis]
MLLLYYIIDRTRQVATTRKRKKGIRKGQARVMYFYLDTWPHFSLFFLGPGLLVTEVRQLNNVKAILIIYLC